MDEEVEIARLRAQIKEITEAQAMNERIISTLRTASQNKDLHHATFKANRQEKIKRLEFSFQKEKEASTALLQQLQKAQLEGKQQKKRIQQLLSILTDNAGKSKQNNEKSQLQLLKYELKEKIHQSQVLSTLNLSLERQISSLKLKLQEVQQEKLLILGSRRQSSDLPSEIARDSNISPSLPDFIGQNSSVFQKKAENAEVAAGQTKWGQVSAYTLAAQIKDYNWEKRVKELEVALGSMTNDKQMLKKQVSKLERENQQLKQSGSVNDQLKKKRVINRRKLEFEGQQGAQGISTQPKSAQKAIFDAIAQHYQSVYPRDKRMPFLNMLAFWTEQKQKGLYADLCDSLAFD